MCWCTIHLFRFQRTEGAGGGEREVGVNERDAEELAPTGAGMSGADSDAGGQGEAKESGDLWLAKSVVDINCTNGMYTFDNFYASLFATPMKKQAKPSEQTCP
jgi:hypothetical protein